VDERHRRSSHGRVVSNNVIVIADLFLGPDILGGAELHDNVVIDFLKSKDLLYEKIRCVDITPEYIMENIEKKFFICNFAKLTHNPLAMAILIKNCKYYIYEHDYKFIPSRNPNIYIDFIVSPKSDMLNLNFYRHAEKVICLSKLQYDIFLSNLDFLNSENTLNVHCSLFSDEQLKTFKELNSTPKTKKNCIIDSANPNKRTPDIIKYCQNNDIQYDLISHTDNIEFLKILSQYEKLYFLPGHPEPTPRIAVEAKALNCKFVAPKKMIGVAHEDWFHLNGDELIEEVRNIRERAFAIYLDLLS